MTQASDFPGLTRDYFAEVVQGQERMTDAFDRFADLLDVDPEGALSVASQVLELATSDHDVAVVGSNALEDLIVRYPGVFVRRAIAEARQNEQLRRALEYVRLDGGDIPKELLDLLASIRGEKPPMPVT